MPVIDIHTWNDKMLKYGVLYIIFRLAVYQWWYVYPGIYADGPYIDAMHPKNFVLFVSIFCLFFLIYVNINDAPTVKIRNTPEQKSEISEISENVIECADQSLRRYFQARGKFWVFYNFVPATSNFRCNETITYTTHADYTFLGNVETLVDRWNGPVSIAVYAPGEDFDVALRSIAYLRNCRSSKIATYVTFHIFFDNDHFPEKVTYNLS